MRIGIPTEIKNNENRVAMTPAGAVHLVQNGHEVFVQKGAGLGSGFTDEEYVQAGAKLVETAEEAWNQDMVMKVKEPVASEYGYFREGLILFTYLHLAPEPELTKALIDNKVASIAYETVQLDNRSLPLLAPMSEVMVENGFLIVLFRMQSQQLSSQLTLLLILALELSVSM